MTRRDWQQDMLRVDQAIQPFLVDVPGGQAVSTFAPWELRKHYGSLMSIGYANGWIAPPDDLA